MRTPILAVLLIVAGCDPPKLKVWTQIVREEPRSANNFLQLSYCQSPEKGSRPADLARCRDVLAPAHWNAVRAEVDATPRSGEPMSCRVALMALLVGDRHASWWQSARSFTVERCCNLPQEYITRRCVELDRGQR
jgi:hypothetical protein